MGFRFYKRVNLIPGLRMNLSPSGPSLSIGHRGAWFTVGPRGKRVTVGGLGTGLFYTTKIPPAHPPKPHHQGAFLLTVVLIVLVLMWLGH
jgi:Protein of unknown function (DUF4236)